MEAVAKIRRLMESRGYRLQPQGKDPPGQLELVCSARRIVVLFFSCSECWHFHADCPISGPSVSPSPDISWRRRHRVMLTVARTRQQGWSVLVVWECQGRRWLLLRQRVQQSGSQLHRTRRLA